MVAILPRDARCRLLGAHSLNLLLAKSIGLEVREAPIGIAVARSAFDRRVIGVDGFGSFAERLQGVRHRQMKIRGRRSFFQYRAIELDRPLVLAESDARRRVADAVSAIGGIDLEQPVELFERPHVLVPPRQHHRVVVTRRMIIGRERENAFKQQFGIVKHVELHADLGEQPHRLDMVAVTSEILANQLFGRKDLAVREQARWR